MRKKFFMLKAVAIASLVVLDLSFGLEIAGAQNAPTEPGRFAAPVLTQTNGIPLDGNNTNANIAGGYATNYTQTIPMTRYADIGFFMSFKLGGAGTDAVTAWFDTSPDGTNWITSQYALSVTPSGTTTVMGYTNITVPATLPYLRLSYITNAGGQGGTKFVTNLLFKVIYKPNRYG